MNAVTLRRAALWSAVVAVVATGAAGRLDAQRGRGAGPGAPPQPARTVAPIDLTGYWVSVVTQDWRWRMLPPAKGDYRGIPLTPEARQVAEGGIRPRTTLPASSAGPTARRR